MSLPKPPSTWRAVVFSQFVSALVLLVGACLLPPDRVAHVVITGLAINLSLIPLVWALVRFCRWLRRKQLEGDARE